MTLFRLTRLLFAVLLAGVAALPLMSAGAVPPVTVTFQDEGTFEMGPCPSGVTLVETFTLDGRETTYFDSAGNPIRAQIHFNLVGVVTNPETGESVEDLSHQTIIVDLQTGTVTLVGLVFSSTVPGVGVVLHDVGKLVFDEFGNVTFVAGPHDVLDVEGGDPTALFCAALGA